MSTQIYPSDLTDPQWALIEAHLPLSSDGRPRKTDLRAVVNAIFYILRTGCQMAFSAQGLPTQKHRLALLQPVATQRHLGHHPRPAPQKVRTQEKPYQPRTTASVDSQSVDTTSGGEQRGRDNAKNVDGRKRHIVFDSMGLLLAVLVTAASVDDGKAATELLTRLEGQPMGKVTRMFADGKYHNFTLYEWVENYVPWEVVIVRRPEGKKGWVKLPIRWTVERMFAWLGKCRRLSKDREKSVVSSEAFVKLAMIHLRLNRLQPKDVDAEFHYRQVA